MSRPHIEISNLVADPLGTLNRGAEEGWLADSDGGVVAALTHERVRELLADPRLRANFPDFLRNLGVDSGPFYEWMALSPLNRDGADHLRWRAAAVAHLHAAQRRALAPVSARGGASSSSTASRRAATASSSPSSPMSIRRSACAS